MHDGHDTASRWWQEWGSQQLLQYNECLLTAALLGHNNEVMMPAAGTN
jgi:hypothetical protein